MEQNDRYLHYSRLLDGEKKAEDRALDLINKNAKNISDLRQFTATARAQGDHEAARTAQEECDRLEAVQRTLWADVRRAQRLRALVEQNTWTF